jgi:hypothetical protein
MDLLTRRSLLITCLSDLRNSLMGAQSTFDMIKQHGGWQHLVDHKGKPFRSFEAFCEHPNGLGLEVREIEQRLTAVTLGLRQAWQRASEEERRAFFSWVKEQGYE